MDRRGDSYDYDFENGKTEKKNDEYSAHVKCESFAVKCLWICVFPEILANIINDLVRLVQSIKN